MERIEKLICKIISKIAGTILTMATDSRIGVYLLFIWLLIVSAIVLLKAS